jgi:hypothetical protein
VLPSLAALVLATATALASPIDDRISGEWLLHNEIANNVSEMNCTFALKGADLTGGCTTPEVTVEIAGKVEDTSVSWVYKSVYNGNPITLKYTGSLGTDGIIKGNVLVEEFSVTGDFTATPVKK